MTTATENVATGRLPACPDWCDGSTHEDVGVDVDEHGRDLVLHARLLAEGLGWSVSLNQATGEVATVELNLPPGELMHVYDLTPAVARSIAAALVRAADTEEWGIRLT